MKEVNRDNMWNEIYLQGVDIAHRFFDKTIIFLSLIFGSFLGAIGYPKEIIVFILILSIIDIISKHLSEVIYKYKELTWSNYWLAWKEKILTSRELKNGVCVKLIMYSIALYVANQLCIINGILFGKEISGVIYSALVFVEISSILENVIHGGCTSLIPLRDYVRNKQKQIFKSKNK